MGTAQSLEACGYKIHALRRFSQLCQMCKSIGYLSSQVNDKGIINDVTTTFTEVFDQLEIVVYKLEKISNDEVNTLMPKELFEKMNTLRLRFPKNMRQSVAIPKE